MILAALILCTVPQAGGDPQECDEPGDYPDALVDDIYSKIRYGTVDGITAFAFGTYGCNIGTCWLNWIPAPSNQHPVITQEMFRYMDGKFEMIGQAWLKHGFFALSGDYCFNDCLPTNGQHLGVHCSDPYSASLNGQQTGMGPKFEIDASAGSHPHPVTDINLTGNAIFKRLQVHNVDLDPLLNPGATYYVSSKYVCEDEMAIGIQDNSWSYRPMTSSGSGDFFDLSFAGPTVAGELPIMAWLEHEPDVTIREYDVFNDGRFIVGSKATDLGNGTWHYEYAVLNDTSDRAGKSFTVPIPRNSLPSQIGFHDVDYHSGEPWENTDWEVTVDEYSITWSTEESHVNPNANALRWGTMYNFRFNLNAEPVNGDAILGLFHPGPPSNEIVMSVKVPLICNFDGSCDPGEECICSGDCPGDGPDGDGDFVGVCVDCDDSDGDIWATPGNVQDLMLSHDAGSGMTTLTWNAPDDPGASVVEYRTLRSRDPDTFTGLGTVCLTAADPTDTEVADGPFLPPAGQLYCYVVRAVNDCLAGQGPIGTDSDGVDRQGRVCP